MRLKFGLDGGQLGPGPGGGESGDAEAEPELVGQLVGINALAGGDGLDPSDRGPLPPSPRNTSTDPGVGQAKWSSQGSPQATLTARSRAAQVLPAFSWAASTP